MPSRAEKKRQKKIASTRRFLARQKPSVQQGVTPVMITPAPASVMLIEALPSSTPEPKKSVLRESVDMLLEFGATQAAVADLKKQNVFTLLDLQMKPVREMLDWPRWGPARVSRILEVAGQAMRTHMRT